MENIRTSINKDIPHSIVLKNIHIIRQQLPEQLFSIHHDTLDH